ncbi:rRNA methylase [Actinoalloteichus sp. GBA129-24]|uniref:rRNA methylase n=1 Tax=Actinoalloteichus fjordicus TaxID=1612552 RepID=A0AAC9PQH4_9PSEU|nr:rRNA methylase [Actinoalloteichus fjordicus]APU19051.1 rRNA methylase [Actinoalloteichus sp. GBA129-24]
MSVGNCALALRTVRYYKFRHWWRGDKVRVKLQHIGAQHPRIRQLISIQKNSAPNPHKLFVAEGLWAHNLLLNNDVTVDAFFWCPEAAYGDEARKRADELMSRANSAYQISAKTLERISERDRPDGLISLAALPRYTPADVQLPPNALVIIADGMEIPGNLGTLIRTFDACRGDCLILTNRRTRLTHPKVFRASQGMLLTTPIIEFDQIEDAVDWLREWDVEVYLSDTRDSRNYRQYDYGKGRTAFVLGAERYGIPKAWSQPDFNRVFVPMLGNADSLNVSVSAAVLLYEARAQKEGW